MQYESPTCEIVLLETVNCSIGESSDKDTPLVPFFGNIPNA